MSGEKTMSKQAKQKAYWANLCQKAKTSGGVVKKISEGAVESREACTRQAGSDGTSSASTRWPDSSLRAVSVPAPLPAPLSATISDGTTVSAAIPPTVYADDSAVFWYATLPTGISSTTAVGVPDATGIQWDISM